MDNLCLLRKLWIIRTPSRLLCNHVAMSARTSSWRIDIRFVIGVLLVIASVVGVWFVVSSARATTAVLVASEPLVPGQRLTDVKTTTAEVALGAVSDQYLLAADVPSDAVVTRQVAAGELIPRGAVGDATSKQSTTIVIEVATAVPSTVTVGAVVEVWASAKATDEQQPQPRILIADAVVANVSQSDSMVSQSIQLELVVPRASVSAALASVAAGDTFAVVPIG